MSDQVRIRNLVEAIKQANTAGWVCDSVMACDGWQKSYEQIQTGLDFFEYQTDYNKYRGDIFKICPWCGNALDWQNWERLKK